MSFEDRGERDQMQSLITQFLDAENRGQAVDRDSLVAEHPELADSLQKFFVSHDLLKSSVDIDSPTLASQSSGPPSNDPTIAPVTSAIDDPTLAATKIGSNDPTLLPSNRALKPIEPTSGDKIPCFGDYELLEEIARGGMGVVYKARQMNLNRTVALKMILSGQFAGEEDVQRFHTEAEAAASLDHPGIVPIFEIGEHAGQHYFSMGFIEGESLAQKVTDGPLPPREAAEIVKKICDAMAYAHERGVIHRDLKPANILIDHSNHPKVTDFGLAKKTEADSGLTGTGQILGTPAYMPPEQASGEVDQVGPLADVYSLGAILYCLLTGRPPFQAASAMDTLLQVLKKEPVAPRVLNPQLPQDLETICLTCLSKDIHRRYASAQDLSDELGRYLADEPILARPVGRIERAWRFCRRNPALSSTAAVAASLLLTISIAAPIVAWVQLRLKREADRNAAEARQNGAQATENAKLAESHLYDSILREAQAVRRVRQSGYQAQVWQRLARALKSKPATEDIGRVRQEAIACLGDFVGAGPVTIEHGHALSSGCSAFLDDERLAVALIGGTILIHDANSGKMLQRIERNGSTVHSLAALQQGQALMVGDTSNLERWNRDGKASWSKAWGIPARFSNSRRFNLMDQGRQVVIVAGTRILGHSTEDGKQLFSISTESRMSYVTSAAASPDGRYLACVGSDPMKILVWQMPEQKLIHEIDPPTTGTPQLEFSNDGQYMVLASDQGFITYRTTDFGQWSISRMNRINDVDFSPDGRSLLFSTITGSVELWNMATQREFVSLSHPGSMIGHEAAAFSPSGKRFLSAGRDATRIWTMRDLPEKTVFSGHSQSVPCIAYHPLTPLIATGSKDGSVALWDAEKRTEFARLEIGAPVQSVAFSHDGLLLAAGTWGSDPAVLVWETLFLDDPPISLPLSRKSNINAVRFSPDGRFLAAGSDSTTSLWSVESDPSLSSPKFVLRGTHPAQSRFMAFDGASNYLATAQRGFSVFDLTSKQDPMRLALPIPISLLRAWHNLAFDPNRPIAYGVTKKGVIEGWDLSTSALVTRIEDDKAIASCHIAIDPTGKYLAVDGTGSTAVLFDLASGERLFQLGEEDAPIWALDWNATGDRLALAMSDGGVVEWNLGVIFDKLRAQGFAGDLPVAPASSTVTAIDNDFTVVASLKNLAAKHDEATLQLLVESAGASKYRVARAAIELLSETGDETRQHALVALAEQSGIVAGVPLAVAMHRVDPSGTEPRFLRLLDDESNDIRNEAIEAIATLADFDPTSIWLESLKNSSMQVRKAARSRILAGNNPEARAIVFDDLAMRVKDSARDMLTEVGKNRLTVEPSILLELPSISVESYPEVVNRLRTQLQIKPGKKTRWLTSRSYNRVFGMMKYLQYYPTEVEARLESGENQFRGSFDEIPRGLSWYSYHVLNDKSYESLHKLYTSRGYTEVWHQAYQDSNGNSKHTVVWIKNAATKG